MASVPIIPPPRFETERLVIEPYSARHTDAAIAGFAASQAEWGRYLPSVAAGDSPEKQWAARLQRSIDGWADGTRFSFLATDRVTGQYVGDCSIGDLVRGNTWECTIGWRVAVTVQGRGMAMEMCRAIVDWTFSPEPSGPNMHRICAAIMPGNDRSVKLAERLGMTYEGTKRKLIRVGQTWHDHLIYGLVNERWRPPQL